MIKAYSSSHEAILARGLQHQRTMAYYAVLYNTMQLRWEYMRQFDAIIRRLLQNKLRYQAVEAATGLAWPFIGAVHYLEAGFNFRCNLHNGQRWDQVTTLVPRGHGPFASWEEAACDALQPLRFSKAMDDLEDYLYLGELHNGLGYIKHKMASPYLWSKSKHYDHGKFVEDGHFSPTAVSQQVGLAVIFQVLELSGFYRWSRAYTPPPVPDPFVLQRNINTILETSGLGYPLLVVDGVIGPQTKRAFCTVYGAAAAGAWAGQGGFPAPASGPATAPAGAIAPAGGRA